MKVLITGGSTRVPIDKVRCISNIFRGRTALDMARVFSENDCDVTLIGTPEMVGLSRTDSCRFIEYRTYDDLYNLMREEVINGEYDVIIHSAAVSDYRVSRVLDQDMQSVKAGKVSSSLRKMYLEMVPTEKIIDRIRDEWGFTNTLVKFKLQVDMTDEELLKIACKSREDSDADYIVANCLEWARKRAFVIDRNGMNRTIGRSLLPQTLLDLIEAGE